MILSLFRRRPVVIKTYHVEKTDWQKLRDAKNRQLAAELGRTWPPKDMSREQVERIEGAW